MFRPQSIIDSSGSELATKRSHLVREGGRRCLVSHAGEARKAPLLSIITVVYNGIAHLSQTIESVLHQTFADYEYLIIDGASEDGSLEVVKAYEDHLDYWISEPDSGIADAMNKGVALAKGEYLFFLHADDFFVDARALERLMAEVRPGDDVVAGCVYYIDGKSEKRACSSAVWPKVLLKTPIQHQAALCSRTLFEHIGGFRRDYKIAMDYEFFMRAYTSRARFKITDIVVSNMRLGVSARSDWPSVKARLAEEHRIHLENCNSGFLRLFYWFYWKLYRPYRCFRSLRS